MPGDTDAGADVQRPVVHQERYAGNVRPDLGRRRARRVAVAHLFQDHHEFIAGQPRHRVGAAHRLPEAPRELDQHRVAAGMAEAVVDGLEAVDVQEQQGQRRAGAPGARQHPRQRLAQRQPVRQGGEHVDPRQLRQPPLGLLEFGHVYTQGVDAQHLTLGPDVGHVAGLGAAGGAGGGDLAFECHPLTGQRPLHILPARAIDRLADHLAHRLAHHGQGIEAEPRAVGFIGETPALPAVHVGDQRGQVVGDVAQALFLGRGGRARADQFGHIETHGVHTAHLAIGVHVGDQAGLVAARRRARRGAAGPLERHALACERPGEMGVHHRIFLFPLHRAHGLADQVGASVGLAHRRIDEGITQVLVQMGHQGRDVVGDGAQHLLALLQRLAAGGHLFGLRARLGDVAGGDGYAVADRHHLVVQPAAGRGRGAENEQVGLGGPARRRDLAAQVGETFVAIIAIAITAAQHTAGPAEDIGLVAPQQARGDVVAVHVGEIDDLAAGVAHRLQDQEGVQAGVGRRLEMGACRQRLGLAVAQPPHQQDQAGECRQQHNTQHTEYGQQAIAVPFMRGQHL